MGTSQALRAACGSKFLIRESVTAVLSCAFCTDLHDFLPNTALFLSLAEILLWSWVKQAAVGEKGSFLLPPASIETSCLDWHLLVHENMLLPFWVYMAQ